MSRCAGSEKYKLKITTHLQCVCVCVHYLKLQTCTCTLSIKNSKPAHTWGHLNIQHGAYSRSVTWSARAHTRTHISSRKHFTERVVRHVAKHLQIFWDKGDRSVWLTGIEPGKTFGMREMEWTAGGDVVPHRASSHGLIFSSCNIWAGISQDSSYHTQLHWMR